MTKALVAIACIAGMVALVFATRPAHAQGFVDEPTCYSWNGGHKSAGSFSKCPQPWVVAQAPAPRPAPVAAVAPAPMQMTPVCPSPTIHKAVKRKPRPAPQKC